MAGNDALFNRSNNKTKLAKQLLETTQKKTFGDDRFWDNPKDKTGNGQAIIRFLPENTSRGDDCPFVSIRSFFFPGPTGLFYVNNSLRSLGSQPDPAEELNKRLWTEAKKTGDEAKEKLARRTSSSLKYISNILVIKDPLRPDNEGKVFLYKYGPQIMNKINKKANPGIDGVPIIDVFDPLEGADFCLTVEKKSIGGGEAYPNYNSSEFLPPKALFGGNRDRIVDLMEQAYCLKDLVSASNFKSYKQLKEELDKVMGGPVEDDPPFEMSEEEDRQVVDMEDDDKFRMFEDLANQA